MMSVGWLAVTFYLLSTYGRLQFEQVAWGWLMI